jgi:sensor domain CHASE-containing protein
VRWRPWSGRDRDPAPKKDALFARDTGRLTVVVPMQLTQGGIGVVSRLPVFLPDASDNTVF